VREIALGIALVIVASLLDVPAVILLGLVLVPTGAMREVWARRGLDGVEYRRHLPRSRAVVGDEIVIDISVWNRKALPLAWLQVEDEASARVVVRERDLARGTSGAPALRNAWTLAPYERVVRHFHVVAQRRGVHRLGPARLEVGDLLARPAATDTWPGTDTWIVRPRSVAVRSIVSEHQWGGDLRARRGLLDDPTRYAGVRPYQPGDPLRGIHWKATARIGRPVSKRFDPARQREVVIALDVEGIVPPSRPAGPDGDDLLESLCVAAASLVRQLRADGAAVGLAAAAYGGGNRAMAYVAPGGSEPQLGRCLDLLARLNALPAAPFERLLTVLVRSVRPGTSLVVLSARDPASYLPALRRVERSGYPVRHLGFGPAGPELAARARAAAIESSPARLDGPWRTATALLVGP
jgi:uncharacterized protein (DUF58 family)